MKKIRWGILSTANIGMMKVVPAMQSGTLGEVTAIASRDLEQAKAAASKLGIPKYYGSYEALLADADIDAVYIPLPNHLHVPWAIKALEANKHVLCEKPLGMDAEEVRQLQDVAEKKPHLKLMEAFMYRFHPQWPRVKQLVETGAIGTLKTIHAFFSYYNVDPANVRNVKEIGGGGTMDIGCYCISISRYIFDKEPQRVFGIADIDPDFGTDRMASGILDFGDGTATFTCSTQMVPYQRVQIFGTTGRIEMEIPYNAPPDGPTRLWVHTKGGTEEIVFEAVDQYMLQGDAFAKAILEDTPVPTRLEDAYHNMRTIQAVLQSAAIRSWIEMEA